MNRLSRSHRSAFSLFSADAHGAEGVLWEAPGGAVTWASPRESQAALCHNPIPQAARARQCSTVHLLLVLPLPGRLLRVSIKNITQVLRFLSSFCSLSLSIQPFSGCSWVPPCARCCARHSGYSGGQIRRGLWVGSVLERCSLKTPQAHVPVCDSQGQGLWTREALTSPCSRSA